MGATLKWGGEPLLGLPLIHSGKVRDSYGLTDQRFRGCRLVVASDRISVFDFVLNAEVKKKGEVLCAMNIFWRNRLGAYFEHDLLAYGAEIDRYLPPHHRGRPDLQKRAVVVHSRQMLPVETIVRGHLTGTGYLAYKDTGMVCGHALAPGLQDGSILPEPLFTPTTKAEVGHDEHITIQDFHARFGKIGRELEARALALYVDSFQYAVGRGIIVADTKFEFDNRLGLCDEALTPDSSRFWKVSEWKAAQAEGKVPQAYDKQFVRNWAREHCVHKLDPKNERDYGIVRKRVVPQEILDETTRLYLEIFEILTGKSLAQFQREDMGIAA